MVTVKKGGQVCFWLAFGQPYLATVNEVHKDQVNALGGPTVDLSYEAGSVPHVAYDPNGSPRSYCLPADAGWPGTLPKPLAAEEAAEEAPTAKQAAEKPTVAGKATRPAPTEV
jgi:hypothetical protein